MQSATSGKAVTEVLRKYFHGWLDELSEGLSRLPLHRQREPTLMGTRLISLVALSDSCCE